MGPTSITPAASATGINHSEQEKKSCRETEHMESCGFTKHFKTDGEIYTPSESPSVCVTALACYYDLRRKPTHKYFDC
jgi:hypothetical protein